MLIIAEIGTSHEGDLDKAYSLIDAAAEAGADAIKFQWVYADEILHPLTGFVDLPTGRIPLYERFRQLERRIGQNIAAPRLIRAQKVQHVSVSAINQIRGSHGVPGLQQRR